MVKERCFILIALVVVILLISDFGICDNIERDEGEVLEFNIKEETARGIIDQKYPDTAGIDIVTDAPWRVIRGRDIPLLIFVPDANLEDKGSNSFHGLNFKRITVFLDSKIIYEDKMDANPSHGVKFKVVDENGKRASSNIAGERHVNSNSSVQCDVSKPGGWHRIIRIPSYMIKKRGMYVYLKTEIVANPVYDKPVNKPIFFSRTLRVYVANGPFPSLGKEWRYYDAHFHTIAEWSLGNKLLSPRKAFGGPIQMIKESSLAMGLIPSIYSFADRVIATDHNAFFSDDYVVPVGPSTGRHKEFKWDKDRFKSERGHIEYENLRDVFGITFGEEITLKTDFKKGGFNGGSHLILLRGEHVDGPWHGGLLSWRIGRKLFGGEENDNTLQSVLNNAASQQTVPFAFAAHPFAKGVHWNMKEGTERYLELLHDNTHDFVTKDGIRKFVFKGVQYWNEKNDYILTVEKAIRHGKRKNEKVVIKRERNVDFFDLHPFAENMSKTRFPPEKGFFKVKERYPAFSPNPDWDNDLKRGLFDWHERIRRLLRFSFGNIPKNKSVEIFPRKIYMFGGSDAHGDFNYQTSLLATILDNKLFRLFGISNRKMTSNAFAKVRTYVNFNGKPGEDNEEKSLNALADGNSVVTDGPVLTFGFDSDIRFNSDSLEWYAKQNDKMDVKKDDTIKNFNCDGRIGGDGNYDGGFTALVVKGTNDAAISYRWNNSGASGLLFGAIDSIKLYVDSIEQLSENSVEIRENNLDKDYSKLIECKDLDFSKKNKNMYVNLNETDLYSAGPIALSMEVFVRKSKDENFRCYTNPIWIVPVEVVLDKAEYDNDNGIIEPGKLKIQFKFEMSMLEKPYEVMLSLLDKEGNVTGAPFSLIPDTSDINKSWSVFAKSDKLKISHGVFHVTNKNPIILSENKDLQKILVCLKHPQDLHGNKLNSIATVLDLLSIEPVDEETETSGVAVTDVKTDPEDTTGVEDSETEVSATVPADSQVTTGTIEEPGEASDTGTHVILDSETTVETDIAVGTDITNDASVSAVVEETSNTPETYDLETEDSIATPTDSAVTNGEIDEPGSESDNVSEDTIVPEAIIETEIIPSLDTGNPDIKNYGRLTFMGGLKIRSSKLQKIFGGLSGMAIRPEDKTSGNSIFNFTAISDEGYLFTAKLVEDFNRKPFGFEECKYSEILDKDSNSIVKTDKRDAEAISISPLNQIIVSFERSYGETAPNRLWSYSVRNSIFSNAKDYFLPQDDKLIKNKGFEAISFLGDDRLIMMSETYVDNIDSNNPKRKYFKGLLLKNGKKDKEIFLERERLRPTDFEELPSGDILILEHDDHSEKGDNGMRKNTVRISRLFCEEGPITNGGILKRDIYHKFHRVDYLDNFEAIASRTDTDGSTVIYILSDNNMNPPDEQENVLLKFKIN